MKLMSILMAVAFVAAVSVAAFGQDQPAPKPKFDGIRGKISKVDGAKITVTTKNRQTQETKDVEVTTDDKTVVTLDKADAKVSDLKVDMFVSVSPATGTAAKIVAFTKMPEHKKPGGDAPAPK
jgi:hypothetical protein